jgi:steroid 5-alpha reductase family enzyme
LTGAPFQFGLWLSALPLLLAAATLTWLLSLPQRNVNVADTLWSLMLFAAGVLYALGSDPRAPRIALVLWPCALWAARLAWHLTVRHAGAAEDRRHAQLRARHAPHFAIKSLYLLFWWRALAAWVVSLPLLGAFASIRPLGWLDGLGLLLWGVGFMIEAVADWQLSRFQRDAANAVRVLNRGLWRYTRHPNYFGEACVWWGFCLLALAAGAWWALPGPLLLTWLLLRDSGIPGLERDIVGRRPQYADYVLKTNAFFPAKPRD